MPSVTRFVNAIIISSITNDLYSLTLDDTYRIPKSCVGLQKDVAGDQVYLINTCDKGAVFILADTNMAQFADIDELWLWLSTALKADYKTDARTDASIMVDYAHHEAHDKAMYLFDYQLELDDTDELDIIFNAPAVDTKWAHLELFFSGLDGRATFELYEGATTSSDGTLVTIRNKNRVGSSDTALATVYHTPTITAVGTLLDTLTVGTLATGVGSNTVPASGGNERATEEWVMGEGTKYLLRVTSGVDTNLCSIRGIWYESTPKNL